MTYPNPIKISIVACAICFASTSYSESSAVLDCKIVDLSIAEMKEGKPARYSGYSDGFTKNDSVTFQISEVDGSSTVSPHFTLIHNGQQTFEFAYGEINTTSYSYREAEYGSQLIYALGSDTASFSGDYIYIKTTVWGELVLRRYYKSDWHGMSVNLSPRDLAAHIVSLDCRRGKGSIDKVYDLYWGKLDSQFKAE